MRIYSVEELDIICAEVERQGASPRFVPALVRALNYAHDLKVAGANVLGVSELLRIGEIINIDRRNYFRNTPVTFRDGGTSARPVEIPDLIDRLLPNFDNIYSRTYLKFLIKELLWIHPFVDGNGRTAFVFWFFYNGCTVEKLPEFIWLNEPFESDNHYER